jgi:diacylglycerol kinase
MLRHLKARVFNWAIRMLGTTTSAGGLPGKNKTFTRSLKNAFCGILFTFLNERNFRFECLIAVLALAAGIILRIERLEWALIITHIFLVLALEMKNTSLELTTDIAAKDYDYNAKGSKDASSGAVFLASISAAINGLVIFVPKLAALWARIVS